MFSSCCWGCLLVGRGYCSFCDSFWHFFSNIPEDCFQKTFTVWRKTPLSYCPLSCVLWPPFEHTSNVTQANREFLNALKSGRRKENSRENVCTTLYSTKKPILYLLLFQSTSLNASSSITAECPTVIHDFAVQGHREFVSLEPQGLERAANLWVTPKKISTRQQWEVLAYTDSVERLWRI